MRTSPAVLACALMFGALGCSDPISPDALSTPDIRRWLTPELAATLDSDGRFPGTVPTPPGARPILGADQARAIAVSLLKTFAFPDIVLFGVALGEMIEKQHGAKVDWNRLQALPRVFYAESPYEPLPDSLPIYVHKHLGPYYMVHIISNGHIAASVGVSAYNTDATVRQDGRLELPPVDGNAYRVLGVLKGSELRQPMFPEMAVKIVGEAAGVRVTATPVLVKANQLFSPQVARWRLELERSVSVRGKSSVRVIETRTLYVDSRGDLAVSAEPTTSPEVLRYLVQFPDGTREERTVDLALRPSFSTEYEYVIVVR